MKKYFLVATITLAALFAGNTGFSQHGGSCPQEDLIEKYTQFTDSMVRFLGNLQRSDTAAYTDFMDHIPTDSIDAFDVYGSRATDLKDSMNALIDSISTYFTLLFSAIDPYNTMSKSAFYDTLTSRINCFLGTVSIEYLVDQTLGAGAYEDLRLAPDNLGCVETLQSGMIAAQNSYNNSLGSCVAALGCPKNFWFFICAGGCIAYYSIVYDQTKRQLLCQYFNCLNKNCPSFIG